MVAPGTRTGRPYGAPPGRRLWWGLRRRCGRCGSKGVFDSYYRMKERCPACGHRFTREEGAFTGVYILNFAVTEGFLFAVLMGYVFWRGITGTDVSILPFVLACVAFAVLAPVVVYPFATSTWAAIDLAMEPLNEAEEREAERWRSTS
jgi:uncharacterized protein (DUF983 family)